MVTEVVHVLQSSVRRYLARSASEQSSKAEKYEWLADVVLHAIPASWVPPAPPWLTVEDLRAAVVTCLAQARNFTPTDSLEYQELSALCQEIANHEDGTRSAH